MTHEEAVRKIAELMNDAKLAMLTTINPQGQLVSRPMALQEVEFNGDVWFFTYDQSNKTSEVQANPQTNVAFNSKNSWVSLSGKAEVVHDRTKAEELWSPVLKAWFPNELDEPGIALLKVRADSAEYWDSSNNKLVNLFGMAKAVVTGERAEGGENETVKL